MRSKGLTLIFEGESFSAKKYSKQDAELFLKLEDVAEPLPKEEKQEVAEKEEIFDEIE